MDFFLGSRCCCHWHWRGRFEEPIACGLGPGAFTRDAIWPTVCAGVLTIRFVQAGMGMGTAWLPMGGHELEAPMAAGQGALFAILGVLVCRTAWEALQRLNQGMLAGLAGECPACGEDVYAYIDLTNPEEVQVNERETRVAHKSVCHNCERALIFHSYYQAQSKGGNPSGHIREKEFVHGRVYLIPEGSGSAL
mmetsp:Transcript_6298/g.23209  ORF Transcript_6298/g.23209 Transcript_6298/m.23209 type:complete len:193 (+) Transcript_6298:682-1260(+)